MIPTPMEEYLFSSKIWILKLNHTAFMVARQHLMTSSERKFHLESDDVWLLGSIVQAWFYIKKLSYQWKIKKKSNKKSPAKGLIPLAGPTGAFQWKWPHGGALAPEHVAATPERSNRYSKRLTFIHPPHTHTIHCTCKTYYIWHAASKEKEPHLDFETTLPLLIHIPPKIVEALTYIK